MSALTRTLSVLAVLAFLAVPVAADERPLSSKEKGEAFLQHLKGTDVDAETVAEIEEAWKEAVEEDTTDEFIVGSLIRIDRDFRSGLRKFNQDYNADAIEKFGKVLEDCKDPYLEAAASYYLARTHIKESDYEAAAPLLQKVVDEMSTTSQNDAEAAFYLGLCQAQLLNREAAIAALDKFLERFPAASERYRITAAQLRDDLKYRGENELLDLADRMKIVERLLEKEKTDDPTQKKQQDIIDRLDELIKKHEQDCST